MHFGNYFLGGNSILTEEFPNTPYTYVVAVSSVLNIQTSLWKAWRIRAMNRTSKWPADRGDICHCRLEKRRRCSNNCFLKLLGQLFSQRALKKRSHKWQTLTETKKWVVAWLLLTQIILFLTCFTWTESTSSKIIFSVYKKLSKALKAAIVESRPMWWHAASPRNRRSLCKSKLPTMNM